MWMGKVSSGGGTGTVSRCGGGSGGIYGEGLEIYLKDLLGFDCVYCILQQ